MCSHRSILLSPSFPDPPRSRRIYPVENLPRTPHDECEHVLVNACESALHTFISYLRRPLFRLPVLLCIEPLLRMKACGSVCRNGARQTTSVSSDAVSLYYLNSGIDLGVCTTWSRDCVISGATAFKPACQLWAGPPRRGVSHNHLQSLSLVLANRKALGILCPRGQKSHVSAVVPPLHLCSSPFPLISGTQMAASDKHTSVSTCWFQSCSGSSDGL